MKLVPSITAQNTALRIDNQFDTGDVIGLAEFFWINGAVGFAEDAVHGHRDLKRMPREDCKVSVLDYDDATDTYRVCLLRPRIPYGAPAPHGTIFDMSAAALRWHAENTEAVQAEKSRKRDFAKQVSKFRIGFNPVT